jgi:hypothetical protein
MISKEKEKQKDKNKQKDREKDEAELQKLLKSLDPHVTNDEKGL